jgi:hypothetical protein
VVVVGVGTWSLVMAAGVLSLSAGNHRCDTLIYSHDFAGVTFAGVQALIRENAQLRAELQQVRAGQQQTDARVRLLETALLWIGGRKWL